MRPLSSLVLGSFVVLVSTVFCVTGNSFGVDTNAVASNDSFAVQGNVSTTEDSTKSCSTLYLLNLVPYPDDSPFAGWDRGFDVIPAGNLAIKHINNRPNVLNGYNLELINIDSEACGRATVTKGLINFYEQLFAPHSQNCVVGIVGLYCSSVTNVIAPLASHSGIDYVILSASTSPDLHDSERFPRVFYDADSSAMYIKSVISMMDALSWKRIGLVYDSLGFYFKSVGVAFAEGIKANSNLELISHIPIIALPNLDTEVFNILTEQEVKVNFWSVSFEQAAHRLCEAHQKKFLWPSFVYIFHDHCIDEILSSQTACTDQEMFEAVEGIFLVRPQLASSENETLISGVPFDQYYDEYLDEIKQFSRSTGAKSSDNKWANLLYDQVWAFALALNNSKDKLTSQNLSFDDYTLGSAAISEIIVAELEQLKFQGASGEIHFEKEHEVIMPVNVYQVRNGKEKHFGVFRPCNNTFYFVNGEPEIDIPEDRFDVIDRLIPPFLWTIELLVQGALFVLITFNFICFLFWRNKPDIKATGLPLSMLIFAGCYGLCLAPVMQTIYVSTVLDSRKFAAMCNVVRWLHLNGINLIIITLILRLLRVFYLFRITMKRTGKFWSDLFLFGYIIAICLVSVVVLIIWEILDPLMKRIAQNYISSAHPPHYSQFAFCYSNRIGIWILYYFAYIIVIILVVLFLAVQTRHIKRQHFKDTKKVNFFVFGTVIITAMSLSLWFVFVLVELVLAAHIVQWLAYFSISLLCQLCLFVPKTFPLLFQCIITYFKCPSHRSINA